MKTKITGRKGLVGASILLIATLLALLAAPSYADLTFTGRGCNGNSLCDIISNCDASGCTNSYENCQSCGIATKVCPTGVVSAPNTCDSSTKQCRTVTPACPANASGPAEPHVILTFNVFTKKNLIVNVTPDSQTGLAGTTLTYQISMRNNNPTQLDFQTSSQIPPNWQINIPASFSVSANSRKDVSFRVTSNATSADAAYPIVIGIYSSGLDLFGTVTAQYIVASRGAPTISVAPQSQQGYPGQTVSYNVSVTNNDPQGFDASSISLRATVPGGFNAVFSPNSIRLQPGETGSVNMDVTSPTNATDVNRIIINATSNRLSATAFADYIINLCGNGVCEMGEESSCSSDCPNDPNFVCNGRCERELDDGLGFSATVGVPFNKFVVCSRTSSLQSCLQAARQTGNNTCGVGKACICTAGQASCSALCVDTQGIYYMAANGSSNVRSIGNYSFACPFVDLPEIKALRDNFTAAKQDYEKAQSALREVLKAPNLTADRRAQTQPCVDALTSLIGTSGDFVSYLNDVIAWPGKMNTTAARARALTVRSNLDSTYNAFCRAGSGLLQIQDITAPAIEKGSIADVQVTLKNIGNIGYFGYTKCDFTGGRGEKTSVNGSCTEISGSQLQTFDLQINATSSGAWSARCQAFGSFSNDCSNASIHDDVTRGFNVSTRDTYIIDLRGSCTSQLLCSVRSSQTGCSACSANGVACTLSSTTNGTDVFACPKGDYGNYTLAAYVLDNSRCKPTPPQEKNITLRCAGCGDGTVDTGEQCETPFSNNNVRCSQAATTCNGKLHGVRDTYGFCTAACGCSPDNYQYSCTRGQCGADCADGETRTVRLNTTAGNCTCVQQCSSGCTWNPCGCEPDSGGGGTPPLPPNARPFVSVAHTQSGSSVTLTATGGNLTRLEIYVDGFIVNTCFSSPCTSTATYSAGVHGYYARASNDAAAVTDPPEGQKSFTIAGQAGNGTGGTGGGGGGGGTTTTSGGLNLTLSHTPQSPTTSDTVVISAVASINADRVDIYVDGTLSKTCEDFVCNYDSAYPAGNHTYFARAFSSTSSVTNPTTGTRSFSVRSGSGGNGTGGLGTSTVIVDVSHSPTSPTSAEIVTITAVAHGPRSFREISIFVDNAIRKTCTNYAPSQACKFSNTYAAGTHSYSATAVDIANSSATDGPNSFSVTAASVNGTPPDTTQFPSVPGAGTGTSGGGSSGSARCMAQITNKSCAYNSNTRRYDVFMEGKWDNGTHAHWEVDGSTGPKIYAKNFSHTEPVSAPGLKTLKLLVHNVNDSNLCFDSQDIYCGAGTTTGSDIDLIIDAKSTMKTGTNSVRVIAIPYKDITNARIIAYTDAALVTGDAKAEGNSSLAGLSQGRVQEDRPYNTYTLTTNLQQGKNVSIVYTVIANTQGTYKFSAAANYSGNYQRVNRTITVTDCPQAYPVVAKNGADCLSFPTPCDVPAGWNVVESCEAAPPPAAADNTMLIVVLIIIVVVAAVVAYRFRDEIRERLHRDKKGGEELPRFEE